MADRADALRAVPRSYAELGIVAKIKAAFLRSESLRGYTLLSPTLLVMLTAMCVPVALLVAYSFWTQDYLEIDKTLTLANYAAFFQKIVYAKLMVRSITISFVCTVATLLLAYPMAYFIAFKVTRNKLLWLILITVPFWTSYLLRVFAWKVILGYNGVINSGLITLGVIDEPLTFLLYNRTAVIITLTHAWAAFAILPIYVSLEKIDRSLLEAATDLGDTPFKRFLRVTLPLSLPGTLVAGLLVFIPTVGDFVTPNLLGGTKGVMIGNVIQSQFGVSNNWPLGASLSIISLVVITVVAIVVSMLLWYMGRGRPRSA